MPRARRKRPWQAPFLPGPPRSSQRDLGKRLIKINFLAAAPKKIKLTVSPDNIGVNGGIATLTATVTDTNGNMVTGANVNFRIIKGPGGGEYIDKPVVTSQNGIAHAQLLPAPFRASSGAAWFRRPSDRSPIRRN
jgi:hypothetical protein